VVTVAVGPIKLGRGVAEVERGVAEVGRGVAVNVIKVGTVTLSPVSNVSSVVIGST
jgi:hypothetical protein